MSDAKTEAYRDSQKEVVDIVPMQKVDIAVFVPRTVFVAYGLHGELRYALTQKRDIPVDDSIIVEYKINGPV